MHKSETSQTKRYLYYTVVVYSVLTLTQSKYSVSYTMKLHCCHPAWFYSLRTEEWGGGGGGGRGYGVGGSLLNGQNLLSMTKVICWRSHKEKIAQTLNEIKNII